MSDVVRLQGLKVTVYGQNIIFYANALNGEPAIRGVVLDYKGAEILQDLRLELLVTSMGKAMAHPFVQRIPLLKPETAVETRVHWDAAALFEVVEPQPGEVHLNLYHEDVLVHSEVTPVEIASPQHWLDIEDSGVEVLPAYVQPNHPALLPVLDKAAELLRERGFPVMFSGYQNMEHVPHMVEALWDAVQSFGLIYSNPLASWDTPGQKIRTIQQIFDDKYATCLDSAVMFASLLENVGLNATLAVSRTHAWVGYWAPDMTKHRPFVSQTVTPLKDLIGYADLNPPVLDLLETTVLCVDGKPVSLNESRAIGRRNIGEKALELEGTRSYIIDLVSARTPSANRRILPMPAMVKKPDGSVEIFEYKPEAFTYNMLIDQLSLELKGKPRSANLLEVNHPPRLQKWLDSLLDLTLRNPLINFRNPKTSLQLLMAEGLTASLEDMLSSGQEFTVLGVPKEQLGDGKLGDHRGNANLGGLDGGADYLAANLREHKVLARIASEDAIDRLRRMMSQAKSTWEETGSNGLYLALGELVWETAGTGKSKVRSPLLLVPVNIKAKNRAREFYISLDESSQVAPNFSLVQKFKADHKLDLTMLSELATDEAGIDVPVTFDAVRRKLADAGLTEFRVDETATLGFFNFSSYRLWRDLVDNWQTFEKNDLVKHLIYTPNVPFTDQNTDQTDINLDDLVAKLPIEADSSQAEAVAKALQGKTFVLQGPPGTGKSQTITNLLARALHEGKRVLFVAEKKDALDVVKDRLAKVGLGAFSLDLHDKAMSPKVVKQQLLAAIKQSTDSDVVGFESSLASYDQAVRPLVDYRAKLHERGSLGDSIYSAIDRYLVTPGTAEVEVSGEFIAQATLESLAELRDDLTTISNIGNSAGTTSTNDWFISTLDSQPEELQRIITAKLNVLADLFKELSANVALVDYLKSVGTIEEFEASAVVSLPDIAGIDVAAAAGESAKLTRSYALTSLAELIAATQDLKHDLRNLRLLDPELELGQVAAAQAASFLTRGSKLKQIAKRINIALGVEFVTDPDKLREQTEQLVAIARAAKTAAADLTRVNGIRVTADENLLVPGVAASIRASVDNLDKLAKFVGGSNPAAANLIADAANNPGKYDRYAAFIEEVGYLFNMVAVQPASQQRWQRDESFGARLLSSLPNWIVDAKEHSLVQLGRVATLNAIFAKLEARGLGSITEKLTDGSVDYRDALNAFDKGYYKALASNLMVKQGFNSFDGADNLNFLNKLKTTKGQLQDQLPKILAAQLAKNRGFGGDAKIGKIGDLNLALTSKRSEPIRTLLSRHWDVISKITPCVLASPDSTVRFLSADFEPFDLVVFDEASQIKVAHAIGALGRGVASIVVGDSKQMPPTSVAQGKNETEDPEDDEELAATAGADAESILEQCTNARVPDVWLNWHYRSEDESLITFSNIKYYEGRLNSFPNPSLERNTKGLRFERVEGGQFIRSGDGLTGATGTNPKEAEAIVAEVARRAKDPVLKNYSLGIVTFNKQQQSLIEDMLFNSKDKAIQDALENGLGGEELLIKNLETVQGSERDVILFSVAFSRRPNGKRLPLNFGPLNNQGGERRLNVAITRAKKQVLVYCSFDPQELKSQNPASEGVANLADFLLVASRGLENQVMNVTSDLDTDRHRSRILKALTAAGLTAQEDVGLSGFKVDIAVFNPKDPTKAVMGILLDGPRWNSRNTVNDRDLLPVAVLENKMGWPKVERIWLPAWLRDEAGEIERIKAAFEQAKTVKPKAPEPKQELPKAEPEPETEEQPEPDFADQLAGLPEFTQAPVMPTGEQAHLDNLNSRAVQNAVRELAADITSFEGPVHPSRLASFVGAAFGYSRVTAKRAKDILSVGFIGHATDDEGFIYPKGVDPNNYKEFKVGNTRHPDQIALTELANLMNHICKVGQGCRKEQLLKVTAQTLGITRLTTQLQTRLTLAIALGIGSGRLTKQGVYLTAK